MGKCEPAAAVEVLDVLYRQERFVPVFSLFECGCFLLGGMLGFFMTGKLITSNSTYFSLPAQSMERIKY